MVGKNYLGEGSKSMGIDIDSDINNKFLITFMDFVKYFNPIEIIGYFRKD